MWEKLVRKLRNREMPPAGMPRPDEATYDALVKYIETGRDRLAEAKPNPGRPTLHRLNRTEYANAIRDLLALEIDVAELLPADDIGYGFDNIGDVLQVSPVLAGTLPVGGAQDQPHRRGRYDDARGLSDL